MSKVNAVLMWCVRFLASIAFYLPIVAAPVAVIATLFADRVPTDPGFAQFVLYYGLWLASVTSFFIGAAILHRSIVHERSAFTTMTMVAGLMLWRVGTSVTLFPETWVALGCLLILQITTFFVGRDQTERVLVTEGGEAQQAPAANVAIRYPVVRPRYAFADVVGQVEIKQRLGAVSREVIESRKKGVETRNGILLTGKPGNGKTFLAEALAGELKLPFLSVAFGDVASKWVNDTTENVVKVFADARAQAPCLLFIDEIDSLIANRNNPGGAEESAKTTNVILTELVSIRRAGVIVVAASNYVDRLDPAAIREGRFDFKVEITPPDAPARLHLIRSKCRLSISDETVATAARRWEGFSVARISAVMEEANRSCKGAGIVTFDQLKVALRTIQGRSGSLPEGTPLLGDLTMDTVSKQRLLALANRMDNIMEIEAMGGSVPRGVLFYGPPGTGKTLTARALAKTANWAFLSASGMDFLADPKKVDEIVDQASEMRPCVVFIDEADDAFKDRRYSNSAAVTNKLLAAMDGSGGRVPDVLFIAATNHPDDMDQAALRGGRFTEKIEFSLPDEDTMLVYVKEWAKHTKARLAPSFSMEQAACDLLGNSIANVKEILQMAVNIAIGRVSIDAEVAIVEMSDLREAIRTVRG